MSRRLFTLPARAVSLAPCPLVGWLTADLVPAALDDVGAQAALDEVIPAVVDVRGVARLEPAVGREGLGGGVRLAPVLPEHGRAAHLELAHDVRGHDDSRCGTSSSTTSGSGRLGTGIVDVDEADIEPWQWAPHAGRHARALPHRVIRVRDGHTELRHPEPLQQDLPGDGLPPAHDRLGKGGAA